jgi:hypothetical protein
VLPVLYLRTGMRRPLDSEVAPGNAFGYRQ